MLTISYYSNVNFPWEISSNIVLHIFHLLHIHRNFPKLQLTVANLHKKTGREGEKVSEVALVRR